MPRAIIVGGSIAGLFAALHLRRVGWQVAVYERVSEPLTGRGAGIVTHDALFDSLEAVGIDPHDNLGVTVNERVAFDSDGRVVERLGLAQVLTSWTHLYDVLMHRFGTDHYHRAMPVVSVASTADGAQVAFADGTSDAADLVVGADGVRSTVREHLEPVCAPAYAGYAAWRGLVHERVLSDRARAEMFPYFAFSLPPSEQMLGYPVAGDGNAILTGHRRYNFVWYRPASEGTTLRHWLTDTQGRCNGVSIAPNRIRPEVLREIRDDAQRLLSPQFAEAVQQCPQLLVQPIVDLEIRQMVHGRVAIIGDAAFVARPHVGMGVTKAAVDARALADCLDAESANGLGSGSIDTALNRFGSQRHAQGEAIIRRARELGAYLQAQSGETSPLTRTVTRSTVSIMHDTATADFLNR